jgi:hypothetical protein
MDIISLEDLFDSEEDNENSNMDLESIDLDDDLDDDWFYDEEDGI